MLETLQYISIIIEAVIAIFGLMIVFQRKKKYGWGIFITFIIYVYYDFAKLAGYRVSNNILYVMFFIATLSMLWVVWMLYKREK
jgi:hypothetical protein